MRHAGLFSAAALALAGFSMGATALAQSVTEAVADSRRPAADTARDENRKPAETVSFAGVKAGDVVAEIAPGGGYYTRVLAATVGPEGKVYALMPAAFASRPGGLDAINALAAQYGNVEVVTVENYADLNLPQPVDLVWTTENYHDIANRGIEPINAWALRALKKGGTYFVEDHSAPGTGLTATSTLHRIDPEAVKEQVTGAGFTFAGSSDHLHNPDDPHTGNPRELNGKSDRFALRFTKP